MMRMEVLAFVVAGMLSSHVAVANENLARGNPAAVYQLADIDVTSVADIAPAAGPTPGNVLVLHVQGMSAPFAAQSLTTTLARHPGVVTAQADLAAQTVTLILNRDVPPMTDTAVTHLLDGTGYALRGFDRK
jgi:hypothetical protein